MVTLLLAFTGCQSPFDDSMSADYPALEQRLRRIDTLDLEAMSRSSEPSPEAELAEPIPLPPLAEISLTVAECRAIALENNLDLEVQRLAPTIARQEIDEAEAAFESLFFANAGYANTDTPTASQLAGSQIEALDADAGVQIPLRTGGAITLDVPISRVETNNIFSTLNPAYTSDFAASISHPLLRNAGLRVNESAIRIARLGTRAAEARTKLAVIGVLAEVERVYWLLYAARRELRVRQQELELAEALLERAERLVDAGAAAEVEVVRAEAGVAERLEAIILAENAAHDRQRDLKRILHRPGLEMNTPTVILIATEPNPIPYELDADKLIAAALDNRMELLELELQLLQDATSIHLARNQTLPFVNFNYTYNVNGLGGSFDRSFDLLNDRRFEDHRFGGQVEVPLGNEAAESRLRRAVLTRLQRLATKRQRSAQIVQEVLATQDQLEAGWQRILASRQRAVLAARVLEAEQRQFEQGLRTATEVLEAQTNLADARSAEVRALSEYQITQVDVAFATGTLLGSTRVRWQPAEPHLNGTR